MVTETGTETKAPLRAGHGSHGTDSSASGPEKGIETKLSIPCHTNPRKGIFQRTLCMTGCILAAAIQRNTGGTKPPVIP